MRSDRNGLSIVQFGQNGSARFHLRRTVLLVVVIAACQSPEASSVPLPSAPPEVLVVMDEYRYQFEQSVPSGRVVFRFRNVGNTEHRPVLLPLSDDLPPIQEQLRGDVRATAAPFAGVPPRQPGESGTFAVDLVPGQRYALVCFARDAEDQSHALLGMATEFRAR